MRGGNIQRERERERERERREREFYQGLTTLLNGGVQEKDVQTIDLRERERGERIREIEGEKERERERSVLQCLVLSCVFALGAPQRLWNSLCLCGRFCRPWTDSSLTSPEREREKERERERFIDNQIDD